MKKDDMNSRVLLAVVVSFLFIIVYSYFVQDPNKQKSQSTPSSAQQAESR